MYESEATKEFVTEVEWLKSSPPITETARRSAQVPGKALPDALAADPSRRFARMPQRGDVRALLVLTLGGATTHR